MRLPPDYAHADELNRALEENPGMMRELSTLNAMTSHYVELQKLTPYLEEVSLARTQAQVELIIAKYSHLLGDNRADSDISLRFSQSGDLELTANGNRVEFA